MWYLPALENALDPFYKIVFNCQNLDGFDAFEYFDGLL